MTLVPTREFMLANYAEAALWATIGAVVIVRCARRGTLTGRNLMLAVTLFAFSGTDVVEARTGAWWQPWWLFTWKAACVAGFVVVLVHQLRTRRTAGESG